MIHDAAIPVEEAVEERAPQRRFRAYPEYRDSGVEVIGPVPEWWQVLQLKNTLLEKPGAIKTGPFGSQLLGSEMTCGSVKVYNQRTVLDRDFDAGDNYITEEKYKQLATFAVFAYDVLVTTRGTIGRCAIVPPDAERGILHPCVMRVQPDERTILREYLSLLIQDSLFVTTQLMILSNATTIDVVYSDSLKQVRLAVPPLAEQRAIAAFLDRETTRIDELIAKKQRLVELLAEKRTALISQAVTKGLNPDAPMKDTGIDWLGQVPEHWDVLSLRRRWQVIDCKHRTVPFLDEGVPLASIGEVQEVELELNNAKRTSEEEYRLLVENDRQPRRGDIIYSRNATVGAAAYVNTDETFCMGQDVCMIRSRQQDQRYLTYQLRSPTIMSQLDQIMVGATFKRVNVADIKALTVACPPFAEQQAIGAYCRDGSAQIQGLMDTVQSGVCRLGEYRSALISAAVTGKIDVRKVKFTRSGLAKRLINAGEYLFAKHDAESALTPICNAIDRVAKDIYGQSGRSTYQQFIHERMELITRVAFNGIAILNLNLAVSPLRDGRGGIVKPKTTLNGVHFYSFEQIIYHVVRCKLDHECEIDPVLRDGGRGSGQVKMGDDGTLQISFDAVAHGLLFAVLSEVDLWSELVGTIYEHVEWKGTPLIDLIGQKKRMHEISKTPAPETAK